MVVLNLNFWGVCWDCNTYLVVFCKGKSPQDTSFDGQLLAVHCGKLGDPDVNVITLLGQNNTPELIIPNVNGSEIRHSPVEVGSLSHYFQGVLHPRWCRISSINSSAPNTLLEGVYTQNPLQNHLQKGLEQKGILIPHIFVA